MKVIIFNTLFYPKEIGGAELSVKDLAVKYKEAGFETVVVSIGQDDARYSYLGIRCYNLAFRNIYWSIESKNKSKLKKILWHLLEGFNIFQFFSILKILMHERPALVHANNTAGFSIFIPILCNFLRIKSLKTQRDYFDICINGTKFKDGKNCIGRCIECKVLTYTRSRVLAHYSERTAISNKLKEAFSAEGVRDISVIYNGIDNSNFAKLVKMTENNRFRFGFIGRNSPEKGLECLINAFTRLLPEFDHIDLIIAGAEDIQSSPRIFSPGRMDKEEFYRRIDILVVPSLWNEPFGRVIVEAALLKIPVILSDRGAARELLDQGIIGLLYDGSEEGLFKIMKKILEGDGVNTLADLTSKAHSNIVKEFSIERSSQKYINKLMELYEAD